MLDIVPYCGPPPAPAELLTRFNTDPVLIAALSVLVSLHLAMARSRRQRLYAVFGWALAAAALLSPLCALSVSLFSARVGQHMILVLLAAPLIAMAWPLASSRLGTMRLWGTAGAFFVALWFWHMPVPYEATFRSTAIYWSMHLTLFGSATLLWRELLHHRPERTIDVLTVGALTSMQMGLLGAILTFAAHPLFLWHLSTTAAWGLSPLHDQQLGGVFMWVPGIALFLCTAIRSFSRLWNALEGARPA